VPADVSPASRIPIGRPIPGAEVYVLDRRGQPVPPGVAGDLHVGGAGLARGYWNGPDLTAARFRPHPFSTAPGARLYATGDRARFRADGTLEHLGREDHQVKVRGVRVELSGVEAVLQQHPDVAEAVVLTAEGADGSPSLVAFAVPRPEPEATVPPVPPPSLSAAALRAFLLQRLPEPMVPTAFTLLPSLPRTANGKIDRRACARLAAEGRPSSAGPVAPRDETEEVLARIVAEVLGLERVGVEDSFFELGGHSLLATQVVSRVRRALGVDLPVRALFESPTVAGLGQAVRASRSGREEDEALQILRMVEGLSEAEAQRLSERPE